MAYTNEQLGKALEDLTAAYNNFVEKAKEAAIAAMSETVIKQIKQDAKDFIADELKTQKNELMQAIENAKTALKGLAIEQGNKMELYTAEKKKEISALITAAENTLKETADAAAAEIKTALEKADAEYNARLKKIVEASKTETENAVLQAKKDLEEQGKAISLKIGGELKEQLDAVSEVLAKKITEANAVVENTVINETKKLTQKLEAEMVKLRDILIHKDAENLISISGSSRLYFNMRIESLKNYVLETKKHQLDQNDNKKIFSDEMFNVEQFYDSHKKLHTIFANTVTALYFFNNNFNEVYKIKIHKFYFLEHIYIQVYGYYNEEQAAEELKRITPKFDVKDCPNFKGFKTFKE